MNSYIEKISLYSFLIFILILIHIEQDNSKPINYASNNLYSYNTENYIDDENNAVNNPSEIYYSNNITQSNTELNNEYSSNLKTEKNEVKNIIESNDVTVKNSTSTYNENQKTYYGNTESGPNNNEQFEEDNINLIESNNTIVADNTNSNTSADPEVEIVKSFAEIGQQFAKSPGTTRWGWRRPVCGAN